MADIKLFEIAKGKLEAKKPSSFKQEKDIQKLCEENLEEIFGIRFLATEYSITKGRIDTLGIDENKCPVIIEYKRDTKENVINQGLFYLDWLMDHKADFKLLCLDELGKTIDIDWSNPRLLCIARNFTKYDDHAIKQIDRNIELIGYRVFDERYIIFELASSITQKSKSATQKVTEKTKRDISATVRLLVKEIEVFIFTLGDDIQKRELQTYIAYTRIKNFVCLFPQKKNILIYVRVPYAEIKDPPAFVRDVTNIGHKSSLDTEITVASFEDFERIKPIMEQSYNM